MTKRLCDFVTTIAAQIIGLIAMIFVGLSYLCKDKRAYLSNQCVANITFGTQYLLLGAMSGFGMSLISTMKVFLFYLEQKKRDKISIYLLLLFETAYVIVGVTTYTGLISIIPCVISLFYTWAAWQPNLKITCIAGITSGLLWVIYNANVGAYLAILSGIVESISSVAGLIKQCRKK